MEFGVVEEAKELWETWNIRVCILLSLFMQACLTFLAPWRKRSKKMVLMIWLLYLLAEAIALYTIGLISNSSITKAKNTILVFWSPFLLVHLGGPDTITALALEDNELWLRHVLELVTQSAGIFYLFYKSFRTQVGYDLLIVALIMYVNGCVKYLERCVSLYKASMDTFRESLIGKPDAGPNYAALMEEYASRRAAHIPVFIRTTHDARYHKDQTTEIDDNKTLSGECETESYEDQRMVSKEMKLVKQSYEFFMKFRGLIVDTMFTFKDRMESREFFLKKIKNGEEAFKVIQIEFNFFYDVFFTKFYTVKEARVSTRVFSVVAVVTSLLLFHSMNKNNTHKYRSIDSGITYVLLGGALIMDVVSIVMLLFSDWTVVAMLENVKGWRRIARFATTILGHWLRCGPCRWSEEIPQYDLLNYCLDDLVVFKAHLFKWVNCMLKRLLHHNGTSNELYDHNMGNLIFEELKSKAKVAVSTDDTKKASEARGDLVFVCDHNGNPFDLNGHYSRTLRPWTVNVDYDESLLLWHIATSLCIWNSQQQQQQQQQQHGNNGTCKTSSPSSSVSEYQKYSKVLGSYMMHLLIMKPSMTTSSVAGIARVRFQDTCEEIQQFIHRKILVPDQEEIGKISKFKIIIYVQCVTRLLAQLFGVKNLFNNFEERSCRLHQFCKGILAVNTERKPVEVKGDRSKSVLFDACRLAKKLIKICEKDGEKKQWELIMKVWVELLCYAASRSKPTAHIAQLPEGGELISLVWLLMAHFGFGEQFRINKGTGWARLIVDT